MVFFDLGTSAVVAEIPRDRSNGGARWAMFVPEGGFGVSCFPATASSAGNHEIGQKKAKYSYANL